MSAEINDKYLSGLSEQGGWSEPQTVYGVSNKINFSHWFEVYTDRSRDLLRQEKVTWKFIEINYEIRNKQGKRSLISSTCLYFVLVYTCWKGQGGVFPCSGAAICDRNAQHAMISKSMTVSKQLLLWAWCLCSFNKMFSQ